MTIDHGPRLRAHVEGRAEPTRLAHLISWTHLVDGDEHNPIAVGVGRRPYVFDFSQ